MLTRSYTDSATPMCPLDFGIVTPLSDCALRLEESERRLSHRDGAKRQVEVLRATEVRNRAFLL
jgi:hypothetical protein